ncbi:PREDICTED: ubiquitin carboxyl-terminal hydrolase 29 [Dipodomys ordii]|uniref:ubiquitinyl hydrolase 1 n=1 Tax=Dipodomys ordii TaxID=10020 RepID=A0A1S3GM53_DIPOR|nr:PREDICTED: ubiquitin carboxyl-terminal hydrolase 29 [Dipodomys ordii]
MATKDWLLEQGREEEEEDEAHASGLEVQEDFLRENNPDPNQRFKTYPQGNLSGKRKKLLNLDYLKKDKNVKLGPSLRTTSNRHPNRDEIFPSTLSAVARRNILFSPEWKQSQDHPSWDTTHGAPLESHQREQGGGFPNLGNTCYMNAILQSLFAIPSFAEDLLTQDSWMKIPLDALIRPLSQLLLWKDLSKVETKAKLLLSIKKAISATSEIFSSNLQNDAHEFLGQCLEQLKKDSEDMNRIWSTEREMEHKDSPVLRHTGDAAIPASFCPVAANFELELQVSITCKACGQMTLMTERSDYLSINLCQEDTPLPPSVQSLLDLFFKTEDVERMCKECEHPCAVLRYRISQLPRVLIVHLKRYSLDDCWQPVKDSQGIRIPRYLRLSPHCTDNPRLPQALRRRAPVREDQVPEVLQDWTWETPSWPMRLAPSGPLTVPVGPEEEAEQQPFWTTGFRGGTRHQQAQSGIGDGDALEPQLRDSGSRVLEGERLPAPTSPVDQDEVSPCVICEDESGPVSIPHPHPGHMQPLPVPENPELKNCEETILPRELDLDSILELLEGSYDHKEKESLEEGQRTADQFHQDNQERMNEALLQWVLACRGESLEPADKDLSEFSELRLHKTDLASDKNPENKDISESESSEMEGEGPNSLQAEAPLPAYRLISAVSHLGGSQNSGHYISDVYNFKSQAWFTFSDLQVSRVPEAVVREERLHCGYIFFYMHNEIFGALLGRQQTTAGHPSGDSKEELEVKSKRVKSGDGPRLREGGRVGPSACGRVPRTKVGGGPGARPQPDARPPAMDTLKTTLPRRLCFAHGRGARTASAGGRDFRVVRRQPH